MANRTQKILGRFRSVTGALDNQKVPDALILGTLNDLQRRLAEDTLCLEGQMSIPVTANSKDYDLSTAGAQVLTSDPKGTINGKSEVVVNSTPTPYVWDQPFTDTYTDLNSNVVPSYRVIIESAFVTDEGTQEKVTFVKTLTGITFTSSSDNTTVRFSVIAPSSAATSETSPGATGFYRLKLIELPNNIKLQPIEIDVTTYDLYRRLFFTSTSSSAYVQIYYKIWDGILSFYPTPQVNYTMILHYYRLPVTDMSNTVDPEIPVEFDTCLLYGLIKELAYPINRPELMVWGNQMFQEHFNRVTNSWRRTKTVSNQIVYQDF